MEKSKETILVVDDTPDNIMMMSALLKDIYQVKVATNGEKALEIAIAAPPDLILLDVMMPVMDGYETCRRLKANQKLCNIPVIFLTARSEAQAETRGFELGAVDYIAKPINSAALLARVKTHLSLKHARNLLQNQNTYLEAEIARRTQKISSMQDVFIFAMASLTETRDNETGNHIMRTQMYVQELCHKLSSHEKFKDILTEENISLITKSAPLHDIGKVGIPDSILLKPAALTQQEFDIMKMHTVLGRNAIIAAEKVLGQPDSFFQFAKELVYSHHECWDGAGYPQGLSGDEIPVSARIMSIADVYDALTSKRVYKSAFPHDIAMGIIRDDSGKHFDPDMVDAFLSLQNTFRLISDQYKDNEPENSILQLNQT